MKPKFQNIKIQYSLYFLVAIVSVAIIVIGFTSVYITSMNYQNAFIRFSIEEKIPLAKNINETILGPALTSDTSESLKIKRDYLQRFVNTREAQYVRILEPDGRILLSTEENEESTMIDERGFLPMVAEQKLVIRDSIFKGEKVKSIIYSGAGGKIIWMAVLPTETIQAIKKLAWNQFIPILISSAFATAVVTGITFFILRSIVRQLKNMTVALEKVQQGNLDVQIDVKSKTEIGQLANAFNRMIMGLKNSRRDLEETKSTLEIRVVAQAKALKELALNLDEEVGQRTLDLREKIKELELFRKLALGRESRLRELEEEVTRFKKELGTPKKI